MWVAGFWIISSILMLVAHSNFPPVMSKASILQCENATVGYEYMKCDASVI